MSKELLKGDDAIQRWRVVLDAGKPVVDEKNAAEFLEVLEHYVKNNVDKNSRLTSILIPTFRVILSTLKLHFDPTLENEQPIHVSWTREMMEEMKERYDINLLSEMVDVMRFEILLQSEKFGKELLLNFIVTDTDIKVYSKPYDDTYVPHGCNAVLNDSEWSKVGEK